MLKAYKYAIFPTVEQRVELEMWFGTARWVYNWGLENKISAYLNGKHKISCFELINKLSKKKKKLEWLNIPYAQCLQMSLRNLDNAFTSFFKKNSRFPKFKSKHRSRSSISFPQGINVNFETNILFVPKIKEVRAIFHRKFEGIIKTCTLSKTPTNKYFISILVEDGKELPKKKKLKANTTIGIDMGIKDIVTISDGFKSGNPKYLEKLQRKLKVEQIKLSKKKMGGKNRDKQKLKVALIHEKIVNQRNDFLHKLSHKLVYENQVSGICVEDLNIEGMVKNKHLAKSINSVSWSKFLEFLKYKCEWNGVNFIEISRWDASSKTCVCGYKNDGLKLSDRTWVCEKCGEKHDRDILAANNIRSFGLEKSRRAGTLYVGKQCLGSGDC